MQRRNGAPLQPPTQPTLPLCHSLHAPKHYLQRAGNDPPTTREQLEPPPRVAAECADAASVDVLLVGGHFEVDQDGGTVPADAPIKLLHEQANVQRRAEQERQVRQRHVQPAVHQLPRGRHQRRDAGVLAGA